MIGLTVVDEKTGKPLPGVSLTQSAYNPSDDVKRLFAQVQNDYQMAYRLQHRPFDEFDGMSLLARSRLDQQTFSAYVGAQYYPMHKQWRWRGRKNTARNRLIAIASQMIAGMLYPLVVAQNQDDEEDKMTARVMRIIVEDHLRKANYETKFLYMLLTALVNPAVFVDVEYVQAYQRVKDIKDGKAVVIEAVDRLLSGLNLSIIPIDQILLADFYTNDIQKQPYIVRLQRLPYDTARKIYGRHPDWKYVSAGTTRVFLAGQEHQTLFDIEWTEGDRVSVQVITMFYRDEDLEVTFVGGVFMGNESDIYNTNRFKHRRLSLLDNKWISIPVYQFAKTYFEPLDPTGRFTYGKSGAFKEFWDDQTQNKMHQLLIDGTYLDVIKPMFMSGVAKTDSVVVAPGAVVGMPAGSTVDPFSLGPNLAAAYKALQKQEEDLADSTQMKVTPDTATPGITATQIVAAQQQARMKLGIFGIMIADLIRQVGELTIDCVIQHTTVGEIDATVPQNLKMKYRTFLAKTSERGKQITNRIVFKSDLIGRNMTKKQVESYEWKLWEDKGGEDQETYHINPYKFARMTYSMYVDPDQIVNHASGSDRQQKILKYQMLTQPFVYPFTDKQNIANDVIEEFSEGDPDRLKAKGSPVNDMMNSIMGGGGQGGQTNQGNNLMPSPMNNIQGAGSGAPTLPTNSM